MNHLRSHILCIHVPLILFLGVFYISQKSAPAEVTELDTFDPAYIPIFNLGDNLHVIDGYSLCLRLDSAPFIKNFSVNILPVTNDLKNPKANSHNQCGE